MITVKYDNPIGLIRERQCIFVSFPYKASIVQVLRGFYSRRWHQDKKCWELPYDCMSELKYLLPNEEFNIIGEPCDTKKYREKELDLDIPLPECKTTPFNYQKDVYAEAMNFNKYILNLEMGTGKAQPLYSKVLTPDGFIPMGMVQVGMLVLGEDGLPHKVLGVYPQGKKRVYELIFSDGSKCRCSDGHLWTFWLYNDPKKSLTKTLVEFLSIPHSKWYTNYVYFLPSVVDTHGREIKPNRALRTVHYVGKEECQCIYIDSPTHLYITDDFIPTHNTMISLLTMKKRMELGQIKRCLIIPCVASLKYNWQEEIRKHLGEESLVLGNRQNRKGRWSVKSNTEKLADLENLPQGSKWLITNVESFRDKNIKEAVKKLIKKGEIDALIIDEVHKLVSPRAQQTKAILSLAPLIPYTLLLTGTILLNRPTDLFVPLKLIDAETKSFTVFKNFY